MANVLINRSLESQFLFFSPFSLVLVRGRDFSACHWRRRERISFVITIIATKKRKKEIFLREKTLQLHELIEQKKTLLPLSFVSLKSSGSVSEGD